MFQYSSSYRFKLSLLQSRLDGERAPECYTCLLLAWQTHWSAYCSPMRSLSKRALWGQASFGSVTNECNGCNMSEAPLFCSDAMTCTNLLDHSLQACWQTKKPLEHHCIGVQTVGLDALMTACHSMQWHLSLTLSWLSFSVSQGQQCAYSDQ